MFLRCPPPPPTPPTKDPATSTTHKSKACGWHATTTREERPLFPSFLLPPPYNPSVISNRVIASINGLSLMSRSGVVILQRRSRSSFSRNSRTSTLYMYIITCIICIIYMLGHSILQQGVYVIVIRRIYGKGEREDTAYHQH